VAEAIERCQKVRESGAYEVGRFGDGKVLGGGCLWGTLVPRQSQECHSIEIAEEDVMTWRL
jgi:hypothetical protein